MSTTAGGAAAGGRPGSTGSLAGALLTVHPLTVLAGTAAAARAAARAAAASTARLSAPLTSASA
jgi:hypothetical protein